MVGGLRLPQGMREVVFTAYELYEKRKSRLGLDTMDRLMRCANGMDELLSTTGSDELASLLLHEVFCDEVQDFVQLQVRLMLAEDIFAASCMDSF